MQGLVGPDGPDGPDPPLQHAALSALLISSIIVCIQTYGGPTGVVGLAVLQPDLNVLDGSYVLQRPKVRVGDVLNTAATAILGGVVYLIYQCVPFHRSQYGRDLCWLTHSLTPSFRASLPGKPRPRRKHRPVRRALLYF